MNPGSQGYYHLLTLELVYQAQVESGNGLFIYSSIIHSFIYFIYGDLRLK